MMDLPRADTPAAASPLAPLARHIHAELDRMDGVTELRVVDHDDDFAIFGFNHGGSQHSLTWSKTG